MQNIHSMALYLLIAFYIVYVISAILVLVAQIRSARRSSRYRPQKHTAGESGKVNIRLETAIVTVVVLVTIYLMTRWLLEQTLHGCMRIGFWNPTCYDMNVFNRSWFAAFVLIGLNAMMLTLIFDAKRQNRRFNR